MTQAPPRLPVTVISGYLGAGKTSLVNHLLRNAAGRRILVMVNDFGAVNVDAELIESAEGETLTLTNGCVCCAIAGDFMLALDDALARRPRPDALVIEASGVAEPARIAAVARAEPEMRFGGVATLVDAVNGPATLDDLLIGPQAEAQVRAADVILLTKGDLADEAPARARIADLSQAPILSARHGAADIDLLLGWPERPAGPAADPAHVHGADYESWSAETDAALPRAAAEAFFRAPLGAYRMKGRLRLAEGGGLEAHRVGDVLDLAPCPAPERAVAAAVGVRGRIDVAALAAAWAAALAAAEEPAA
ncbi:MAG: GTP-binding protein [Pseudomonadota bacterium]